MIESWPWLSMMPVSVLPMTMNSRPMNANEADCRYEKYLTSAWQATVRDKAAN